MFEHSFRTKTTTKRRPTRLQELEQFKLRILLPENVPEILLNRLAIRIVLELFRIWSDNPYFIPSLMH
jgi:hypothetical protein